MNIAIVKLPTRILGLLHDIGRKFGVKHLGYVYDVYTYMQLKQHYEERTGKNIYGVVR